jgi:hypothetical protein
VEGNHFPVFDELMPFAPAEDPTLSVHVGSATGDDIRALADIFALDPARRLLDRWRDAAPDIRTWTNLHVLMGEDQPS